MIIDGHPVLAEFISEEADQEVIKKSEEWKSKHVYKSQYFLQIVKCKDSKCCIPFRSNYLKVVKDRFLPPPIPVTRTTTSGLKWVQRDVDAHYLSLIQNLALKVQFGIIALKNFPKGIPYDYSCPAAQNIMERRMCSKCRLYLASIRKVSLHEQMHKKQKTTPSDIPSEPPSKQSSETIQPPRLRPQRVAARRQKELLCAFQFQEFEWMELDDVDTEGLVIPPVSSIKSGTPITETSEAIWSEE